MQSYPYIETERLILRRFTPEDLDQLAEILADPEVVKYLGGSGPLTREKSQKTLNGILEFWEEKQFGNWAVTWKDNPQKVLGWCGLGPLDTGEIELLYMLAQDAWGQGVASEAACASLRFAFEETDLEMLIALAFEENIASRRVLEKNQLVYLHKAQYFGHELMKFELAKSGYRKTNAQYKLVRTQQE